MQCCFNQGAFDDWAIEKQIDFEGQAPNSLLDKMEVHVNALYSQDDVVNSTVPTILAAQRFFWDVHDSCPQSNLESQGSLGSQVHAEHIVTFLGALASKHNPDPEVVEMVKGMLMDPRCSLEKWDVPTGLGLTNKYMATSYRTACTNFYEKRLQGKCGSPGKDSTVTACV